MSLSASQTAAQPKILKSKLFWISLLYFSEGFPLGLFFDLFPVYFRQQGVELSKIGLLSLLGLSWTLKFLWAPLIDFTRRHRYWMAAADVGMGLVMIICAREAGFGPWVWFAIGAFTALSATNDIAIDGYTIEQLNKQELGLANGFRIGFYRVGMLAAGILLWFSDVAGWTATYGLASVLFFLIAATSLFAPKEPPRPAAEAPSSLRGEMAALAQQPVLIVAILLFIAGLLWPVLGAVDIAALKPYKSAWWFKGGAPVGLILLAAFLFTRAIRGQSAQQSAASASGPMFGAIVSLLNKQNALLLIGFILIFKLADSSIGFMIKPFWVDSGFTNTQIGLVSVNLGLGLSIAGGIIGGWYTDKVGIFRGLWVLGLWQALSNIGYVIAAAIVPRAAQGADIALAHQAIMYGASAIESFTGGLGTAAFLAFLMAIVDKSRATTEYAILSSIFAFSRSIAGWAGGIGAQEMGYAAYFLLTFVLAFPAYALLPWIKTLLAASEEQKT
ncbi:MFS transporter [Noviherbaspirillum aridicola]|uniref:MFS transporter n=1 Tax=Noviherbaspirillum aridicola TaxID=2849687 RepID=A0ABQ4Q570_9BURK|nr:MFS transporter [Noviherbaspirillum aridicola]GIZ52166.1 MFS transporter [Noviherbaspirillum aridicola]